jgi:hypothetical protein
MLREIMMAKRRKPFIPKNKLEKKYYREYLRVTRFTSVKKLSDELSFTMYMKYRMAVWDIHKNYNAALTAEKIAGELLKNDNYHRERIMKKGTIIMFPHDFSGYSIGAYDNSKGAIQKKRHYIWSLLHRHISEEAGKFILEERHSRYLQLIKEQLQHYRDNTQYDKKRIDNGRIIMSFGDDIIKAFKKKLEIRKTTEAIIGVYSFNLKVVRKESGKYGLESYYGY